MPATDSNLNHRPLRAVPLIISLGLVVTFVVLVAYPVVKLKLAWPRFVQHARKTADPVALQQWGKNLLALHPDELYFDVQGTNVPPDILALGRVRPCVGTIPDKKVVVITWGRGSPSIQVGPPSYVFTNRPAELWIPGVYFVKPSD